MRRKRQNKKKNKEKPTVSIKPEAQVIQNKTKCSNAKVVPELTTEIKKQNKKHHSDKRGSAVRVAGIIADVINPAMYILFSIVYFMIGMNIRQNPH